ncbi:hypothetical protein RND71_012792 [Anisodus tanguticus]|uniref:riboflavin kinase n=1 Tax=Anisodus tanguticus TaxID=243964 RepID=A0AAE1SFC5_9SOLA|nr:hypothetical protein RND71_012792 [Anisodus tanguticus]
MGDLHSANNHVQAHISAVIFYLDGTLLSAEHLTKRILKEFLSGYGKVPDKEKEKKRLGMTQKDFTLGVVNDYDLPLTPDQFLEAAKQMGADAAHCLVIEDSVSSLSNNCDTIGVEAGKAAGMKVVAVPSFHSEFDQYSIADSVLRSLLELKPELWVSQHLKTLSSPDDGPSALPGQVFGVYFCWAKPEAYKFVKIVLGVGWEHGCCSSKRKMQTCIIDSSDEQIQDCKMEVVIVGYIRGSCDEGKSDKVEILEEDESTANAALNLSEFSLGAFKSLFPEVALQDYCNRNGK